ncbi:MAG: hypothetical protein KIT84_44410 [Labilithrix sp.]|nr:hypothetical protein [Labilithrix sp.]MCW5818123.1 hypothetical protein [Labilithrix sp.]
MKPTSSVAALTIALVLTTTVARGDEDPSAIAAARAIGTEGLHLAEAGNCKDALEKLDRAERLHHAPTTLEKLGECNILLGHLVLGAEQLRRLTREPLDPKAPAPFVQAKARAQKLLDETMPRIAQLRLEVTVAAGVTPTVTIDGELVPPALVEIDRPTDPGPHVVEATAPGHKKVSQAIELKEGERLTIKLAPEPEPTADAPPPPVLAPPVAPPPERPIDSPPPPPPEDSSTMRVVGWSLLGVGAAGLVTGVVAGALGLGTKSSLDESCGPERLCDPDQRGRLDRLQTEATIGTIGFVVGGVGLAGGAAVLLFGPKMKSAAGLGLGPGSVSWRGTF